MNNELENSIKYIKENTGDDPKFSVPENYFNGIEDEFSLKLKEEKLPKGNSFKLPDDYFNMLEDKILDKVKVDTETAPKETKVISFKNSLLKFIPTAVAASLILFVSVQFFKFNSDKPLTIEDVSLSEIENWFDETISFTDNTVFTVAYEATVDENELTPIELQNDAIEAYFNTIDDHSDLLNEIQ